MCVSVCYVCVCVYSDFDAVHTSVGINLFFSVNISIFQAMNQKKIKNMWKNAEEATVQTVWEWEGERQSCSVSLKIVVRKNRRRRLYLMPSTHTWVHWKTTITRHKRHESKQWEGNTDTHTLTYTDTQFLLLLLLLHHQVWRYISIDQLKSAKMSGKSYQLEVGQHQNGRLHSGTLFVWWIYL